ncbi:hypothetical protein [Promicromonospora sp. NPDC023987]|uniref:hypothetical protein n=1 Tax=Promicromonospora sp. NPDC023987 TaxID=3155360 RepID=UPI0033C1E667
MVDNGPGEHSGGPGSPRRRRWNWSAGIAIGIGVGLAFGAPFVAALGGFGMAIGLAFGAALVPLFAMTTARPTDRDQRQR